MKHWLEPSLVNVPEDFRYAVGGEEIVSQILVRRGITTPEAAARFFDPDRYQPSSPYDFPGMAQAVERIETAIRKGEQICIWGDFDADGQTATSTLVSTLGDLNARVTFHIPVRARESHGVNLPFLQEVISQGVRLIVTCDTGITAMAEVEYARQMGVDFIITDHHELPEDLPKAVAVIDSRILPPEHPMSTLPGVGVAYKLSEALYSRFGRDGEEVKNVDLAALGIVADLADLTGEARYLVQLGLRALHRTQRPAIQALLEAAEINPTRLTETHIGFELAPCLNALGRLDDANRSVEFFTTPNLTGARVTASILEGLNSRRQLLTKQVLQAAEAELEKVPALLDEPVLILSNPNWPAGVVGIVASHLVERFNRPVILLVNPAGQVAHGSARSVAGCDITAAIATQANLLAGYGGHPMAAGLSLDGEKIVEFKRGLMQAVRQKGWPVQTVADLQIDGYFSLADLSLERVEDIQRLAPFGPGNPPLNFAARHLLIKNHSKIGRNGEHLQLMVEDVDGNNRKVIWWQAEEKDLPEGQFDLAFNAQPSDFRGVSEVQMVWVDARVSEPQPGIAVQTRQVEVIDYRSQVYPLAMLKQLLAQKNIEVWSEAEGKSALSENGIQGRSRYALAPNDILAIWTTPPGLKELQEALAKVSPHTVYLFGVDPKGKDLKAFLNRLAGLVNYALKHTQGEVSLEELAAATAQRETTVHKGLEWLASQGYILISEEYEGKFRLIKGLKEAIDNGHLLDEVERLVNETSAFRRYFHKADPAWLF